jgi:hypothetical protein
MIKMKQEKYANTRDLTKILSALEDSNENLNLKALIDLIGDKEKIKDGLIFLINRKIIKIKKDIRGKKYYEILKKKN